MRLVSPPPVERPVGACTTGRAIYLFSTDGRGNDRNRRFGPHGLIFAPVSTSKRNISEYDAGDRRHVERRGKAQRRHERRLDEAFKWLMEDARGRMLMWVRLGQAGAIARLWDADLRPLDDLDGRRLPEAVRRALLAG